MELTIPNPAVAGECPHCGLFIEADWGAWYDHGELVQIDHFRERLAALIEAAERVWHYGDGYGGWAIEEFYRMAEEAGLPMQPPREFRQRSAVLRLAERDGWCCHYCQVKLAGHPDAPWPQVEHIVPRSSGGGEALTNKVLACPPCNTAKGTSTYEEFTGHPYQPSGDR